jgi:methylmalonyl-CoA/ethylmalonyl-CoA epimerase
MTNQADSADSVLTRLLCVSIAVPQIADVLDTFVDKLGFHQRSGYIESQRFDMNWVELGTSGSAGTAVELLEPTGDGPVQQFLQRRPPGVYQVRFGVSSLDAAVELFRSRGLHVIVGEHVEGHPDIAWVHPKDTGGVLLELLEEA